MFNLWSIYFNNFIKMARVWFLMTVVIQIVIAFDMDIRNCNECIRIGGSWCNKNEVRSLIQFPFIYVYTQYYAYFIFQLNLYHTTTLFITRNKVCNVLIHFFSFTILFCFYYFTYRLRKFTIFLVW